MTGRFPDGFRTSLPTKDGKLFPAFSFPRFNLFGIMGRLSTFVLFKNSKMEMRLRKPDADEIRSAINPYRTRKNSPYKSYGTRW